MNDRRCCYCQQVFQPSCYHPRQAVCSQLSCQRQRQRDYHRDKIASDPIYRQVCLDSPRKWRQAHPAYWTTLHGRLLAESSHRKIAASDEKLAYKTMGEPVEH